MVGSIYVEPWYRDRGVGRSLMEWAEKYSHQMGYSRMTLNVFAGNQKAMAMYESLGPEAYQSPDGKTPVRIAFVKKLKKKKGQPYGAPFKCHAADLHIVKLIRVKEAALKSVHVIILCRIRQGGLVGRDSVEHIILVLGEHCHSLPGMRQ